MAVMNLARNTNCEDVGEVMSPDDILDYVALSDALRLLEMNMITRFLKKEPGYDRRLEKENIISAVQAFYTAVVGVNPATGQIASCEYGCIRFGQCVQCQPA